MALETFADPSREGTHLSDVLKSRMGDLHIGDPYDHRPPMLALPATSSLPITTVKVSDKVVTDVPEAELPTAKINLKARKQSGK